MPLHQTIQRVLLIGVRLQYPPPGPDADSARAADAVH